MLSKKQLKILSQRNNYHNLALEQPKIVYLIRKYKIEPFITKLKISKNNKKLVTKIIVQECARLCLNRTEFTTYFEFASNIAKRDGYFDELMKNKPFWKDNFTKYDLKSILKLCEKSKIKSYSDFRTMYPSPYQQAYQQGWSDLVKMFLREKTINQFIDISTFLKKHKKEVDNIQPRKLNKKMKLNGKKYSDEYLISVAKQFDNAKSFSIAYPLLYKAFLRRGLNSDIFKNPISHRYTDQELLNIASMYFSKAEFVEKNSGAFWAVKNRGLLDQACAHMKKLEESLGESLVRKAFNYHFNTIFYKIRPEWLKNPKTNHCLELDGYNANLRIAFEVNGGYHFKTAHKDKKEKLEIIKYKDRYKKKICKKQGVDLYVFEYKSGNLNELCSQLNRILGIPKTILNNFKLETLPSLTESETIHFRKKYSIDLDISDIAKMPMENQCNLINLLRMENLSNYKISQVLNLKKSQLTDIITKINKAKLYLINR